MGGPNPMCHPKGVPTPYAILRGSQMGGSQPHVPSQGSPVGGPNPMCHPKGVPWGGEGSQGVPPPFAILGGSRLEGGPNPMCSPKEVPLGGSQSHVPSQGGPNWGGIPTPCARQGGGGGVP